MTKVFIDGSAGTTGLRIYDRLRERKDLELLILEGENRKDPAARADALDSADIAFLCLPDAAAREDVTLISDPDTVIIDTSTAHRTAEGWAYGFPELKGRREEIAGSKRIANPGCHASGFISLIAPLTENGIIAADAELSCFSLTGYSGGGKKMIAEYEGEGKDALLEGPRMYGLSQAHKHIPEMLVQTGLKVQPAFCPVVADFYAGMEVVVPLFRESVKASADEIKEIYREYYKCGLVKYIDGADEAGFLSAAAFAGRDDMQISVFGSEENIILVSRFDNLGKGASGAAIQNMNIVLGFDEASGLNI